MAGKRPPKKRTSNFQNRSTLSRIYYKFEKFSRYHPIASTGLYLFIALIIFRFALMDLSFKPISHIDELHFWLIIIGLIMVSVAIFSVLAWWRRTIPDIHVKSDVTWRSK